MVRAVLGLPGEVRRHRLARHQHAVAQEGGQHQPLHCRCLTSRAVNEPSRNVKLLTSLQMFKAENETSLNIPRIWSGEPGQRWPRDPQRERGGQRRVRVPGHHRHHRPDGGAHHPPTGDRNVFRAANQPSQVFIITEKAPTRAFSLLKAPTSSAFSFKTLC